jgi:hypothetical protein
MVALAVARWYRDLMEHLDAQIGAGLWELDTTSGT